MGDGGGEQRDGEAAILAAGGLDEAAGVLAVGAAEELTNRPSRRLVSGQRATAYSSWASRVNSASRQTQAWAWSRRPIRFSASACRSIADAGAALIARPGADHVDRLVEGVGVAQCGELRERLQLQLAWSGCAGCR